MVHQLGDCVLDGCGFGVINAGDEGQFTGALKVAGDGDDLLGAFVLAPNRLHQPQALAPLEIQAVLAHGRSQICSTSVGVIHSMALACSASSRCCCSSLHNPCCCSCCG